MEHKLRVSCMIPSYHLVTASIDHLRSISIVRTIISMTFFLAENCGCSNGNENDDIIEEKFDEAKNVVLKHEQQANDKPSQGFLGSILAHLISYLKSVLSGSFAAIQSIISNLPDSVASALKGLSKNGLIGFLGGLARSLNEIFREAPAKSIIGLFTGE